MGTSVSHPSPATRNWAAVAAAYRRPDVPEERVVQEVWRAAQSDPDANWADLLSAPIVPACLEIALASGSPAAAVRDTAREIARTGQSSIAADIAKRAVVRSFGADDRRQAFVAAVFGEATSYLVSRDLPDHIGDAGRNRTVGEGVAFKEGLRARAERAVRELPAPAAARQGDAWPRFVGEAVRALAGQR
jgi:hypothetical protein